MNQCSSFLINNTYTSNLVYDLENLSKYSEIAEPSVFIKIYNNYHYRSFSFSRICCFTSFSMELIHSFFIYLKKSSIDYFNSFSCQPVMQYSSCYFSLYKILSNYKLIMGLIYNSTSYLSCSNFKKYSINLNFSIKVFNKVLI